MSGEKKEYIVPVITFPKNPNNPSNPNLAVFVRPPPKNSVDIKISLAAKQNLPKDLGELKVQEEKASSSKKEYVVPTISFPKNTNNPDTPYSAVFNRPEKNDSKKIDSKNI